MTRPVSTEMITLGSVSRLAFEPSRPMAVRPSTLRRSITIGTSGLKKPRSCPVPPSYTDCLAPAGLNSPTMIVEPSPETMVLALFAVVGRISRSGFPVTSCKVMGSNWTQPEPLNDGLR